MIYEKIKIWDVNYTGRVKGNAFMEAYIQESYAEMDINRKRPAVCIKGNVDYP